jgi:hypothetical protein
MAKRKNLLGPIDHERHQLLNLKTLEPVTTPEDLRPLSDTLIDLALAALDEVYRLEAGQPCEARRLERIYHLASTLPNMVVFERRNRASKNEPTS